MDNFPPNLDPKIYDISAIIIGFALIGNFTAAEQNAIGNWFITLGQVLENNSAWQQVIEGRITGNNININSKKCKETGDPYTDDQPWMKNPQNNKIDSLEKSIKIIEEQLKKMQ